MSLTSSIVIISVIFNSLFQLFIDTSQCSDVLCITHYHRIQPKIFGIFKSVGSRTKTHSNALYVWAIILFGEDLETPQCCVSPMCLRWLCWRCFRPQQLVWWTRTPPGILIFPINFHSVASMSLVSRKKKEWSVPVKAASVSEREKEKSRKVR